MNLIKNKIFEKIPSYLFLLLPLSIVFSKFFADLTVVIFALLFFFIKDSRNFFFKYKYYNNLFFVLFFLFITFSTFSSILSSNQLFSLKSSLLHFRFLFFSLFIAYILFMNLNQTLKIFFYTLLGVYALLLIDGTYQFIFKENLFGYKTNPETRVSSFFFDELVLGSYLSRLFPILVFLYLFLNLDLL